MRNNLFSDCSALERARRWKPKISSRGDPEGLAKRIILSEIKSIEQRTPKPVLLRKGEVHTNLEGGFSQVENEFQPEVKSKNGAMSASPSSDR